MASRSAPPTQQIASSGARSPMLRFEELQGQRGLAALLVVVFHAYQYHRLPPDGRYQYAGYWLDSVLGSLDAMVDWFFVLSAFLLTLPYARAVLRGSPMTSAAEFLARRAVRIVPLYLIAVLVVWAFRNPVLPGDWRDLLEHLTFVQVYDQERIFYTIGPAWSLAVEVQFYVALVLVMAVVGRLATRTQSFRARLALLVGATAGLALVTVIWAVLFGIVSEKPYDDWHIWFGLPAKLAVFAVGMAVAIGVALKPAASPPVVWALRGAGIGLVVLAIATRQRTGLGDVVFHIVSGVGFGGLVLASVFAVPAGRWHTVLARGFLPWAGVVSYSLYLWHEPLLLWLGSLGVLPPQPTPGFGVTALILVAAGLLVAWISYWVIEYPFSNLRFFIGGVPDRELRTERRTAP